MPTILLVEDNRLNREMCSRCLERKGFHVVTAGDGREAIRITRDERPALVLMDLSLPIMDGWEATRRLKADPNTRHIPVIALTAHAMVGDREKAIAVGCDDYETKPPDLPRLLSKINNFLSSRSGHGEDLRVPSASLCVHDQEVNRKAISVVAEEDTPPPGPSPDASITESASSGLTDTLVDGTILAGYEILSELGRGGMGVVYKARHICMNRTVSLKVIHREHLGGGNAIQRFYREVQVAAQLSHRNIVLAYDAGKIGETHYFAMEYIEGEDLQRLVGRLGPLPVRAACDFILQAAQGIQHAFRRGLVHRDIKPSNLFATWEDSAPDTSLERATIKILDFGLALLSDPTDEGREPAGLTRDGRVVGTADYMAPEQWMNAHKVDVRADLYTLGGTLYFLLTGQVLFPDGEPMEKMLKHHMEKPTPVRELRPDVPEEVAGIVERLLAKKPEQRFQQPSELMEALKAILR